MQRSYSKRIHPPGKEKTSINSLSNELFGILVSIEDGNHKWGRMEVSELRQYGEVKGRNCNNLDEIAVELALELQDGSKVVLYY